VASNLSVGSGVIVIFAFWAHLTASARFRARAPSPVSGRLSTTTSWRTGQSVVVSRCLSGTGIRFSVILRPPGSWALLTVGLPAHKTGPRRGFRVPHARAATGLGALYTPGTAVLIPTDGDCRPTPAASLRPVPAPRNRPIGGGSLNDASTRVQAIRPSGLPQPVAAGWNGPPLGSSPGLRTPPTRSRRRTPGWGQAIEHGPGPTAQLISSISNPVGLSMRATSRRTSPTRS
jgi:hypothetical protein